MRFKEPLLILFAAPLFWAFGCGDSEPFSYQLRPTEGISYKAEDTIETNIQINAPSGALQVFEQRKIEGKILFKKEKDGTLGTYNGASQKATSSESGRPTIIIGSRRLRHSASFTFKADESGNIVQPPPIQALIESSLAKTPARPKSERADFSVDLFLIFSMKTYQTSQRFLHIPPGKREVGDVWNVQLEPMPGVQTSVKCALEKRSGGKALIEAHGLLKAVGPVHMAFAGAPQFEAQYRNMQGTYRANYTIDEKTGLLVNYKARTELQADLETTLEDGTFASIPLLMEVEAKGKLSD
ncbi:MAG: DUF6263 family protein [Candidatus Poribacteria bacterium]|nr:DUF6263 family protein [Candidatus Poribacteria bacterium]